MNLSALREDKASRVFWDDPRLDQHHRNLQRALTLVQANRGRLTTAMATRLTGWEYRSTLRYLNELRAAGLVSREPKYTIPFHWYLTQAGTDELSGVT